MKSRGNCYMYSGLEIPDRFEYVDENIPSLTVPNMSMTVEQLLERYQAGGELQNAMGVRFDIPHWMDDEEALELYQRYDDDPDELLEYQRLSAIVTAAYSRTEKVAKVEEVSKSDVKVESPASETPASETPASK